MTAIRLVAGLGNPGIEYQDTRHNAGFWWVDRLASREGASLKIDSRMHGIIGRAGDSWLIKPQTFMNASGRAVSALSRFYKIPPSEILVVHDELDLEPGTVRLKLGGGLGGHNGLKDISAHLGTQDYWRLRLGIGHPGERSQVSNFVLKPPSRQEEELILDAIEKSLDAWHLIATGQQQAAMLKLHTKS
ncbi:MAG: aminoacyl-tRNA hydrolase [Burkholderiales bacterium]|nr:aminoacyl-tRNA hydrolase [Burkholderiales bacterium]